MSKRSAFVTGATGFLGLNLVKALCADGWQVRALHRSDKGLAELRQFGAEPVQGGIDDPVALAALIPERVDALFHVAASTSLWRAGDVAQTRTNVDGTRHVLQAARSRHARRFVQTSSVAAWGDAAYAGVLNESTPSNAAGHWVNYFRSKWLADQQVEAAIRDGLDAVFIHPANVVGPYDDHNWSSMISLLAAGKLPGTPPGAYAFCHVEEVARAHIAAVDRAECGAHFIVGGVNASYAEFVALVAARLGCKIPPVLPGMLLKFVGQMNQLLSRFTGREPDITPEKALLVCTRGQVDSSRAEQALGFRALPLEQLVDDTLAWMRASGRLPS